MRVKICGITNLADALAACEAGADALGFVFAEAARTRNRYIEPETAQRIVEQLPPYVTTVGVCVDDTIDTLRGYLTFLDRVQLHGAESPEICAALAGRAYKAFGCGSDFDISGLAQFSGSAYLLDATGGGGSGASCDWTAARKAAAQYRIILAGGLTPDNVAEAVRIVQPYAVDTSGGVEASPGKKDHERIRRFIQAAKTSLPG